MRVHGPAVSAEPYRFTLFGNLDLGLVRRDLFLPQINAGVVIAKTASDNAAHGAASEGVKDLTTGRAEPSVHDFT